MEPTVSEIILRGILSNAYKLTEQQITDILGNKDGNAALQAVLDIDATRVNTLGSSKFEEGRGMGTRESMTNHENNLREKFGIADKKLMGLNLVEAIVTAQLEKERAENPGGKSGKGAITDDDIKKHPLYLSLEEDRQKAILEKEEEWKTKFEERERSYTRDGRVAKVKEKALNMLNPQQYVFPEDETIATNQRNFVINNLSGFDYEETENGVLYPIKDGKRIDDRHGNAQTLEEFISEQAKMYFPARVNNGGTNPDPGAGGNGGGTGAFVPKSAAELDAFVADMSNSYEAREAALNTYGDKF